MAHTIKTELLRLDNGIKVEDAITYFKTLAKNKISSGIHKDAGKNVLRKASHTEFGTGKMVAVYPDGWVGKDIPAGFEEPYGAVKNVPPRPAIRMFLYPDMKENITDEYQLEMNRQKKAKLKNPKQNAIETLEKVGKECVVMQRDKMANGDYDQSTNDTGLDPEHNGTRTIEYKGFDDTWVETGETIASVSYKVTKK